MLKGRASFTKTFYGGTNRIGREIRDENSEKKKTMTINTKKIAKKNGGDKNYNPIKYSYKPGVRKQKLNSY